MSPKTPVSYLQEICVKYVLTMPKYVQIAREDKMFEYSVGVSDDCSANGTSSSKQNAKHAAARNLLDILKNNQKYSDISWQIPDVPTSDTNNNSDDPVSGLMIACQKRVWDIPTFFQISSTGPSNSPTFVIACEMKGFHTEGKAGTKSLAKKAAAEQMLIQLEPLLSANIVDNASDTENVPPKNYTVEEVSASYRKLHKWNRTSEKDSLADRHFFFEKYPTEKKAAAMRILKSNDTPREIVNKFCQELDIQYRYSPVKMRPNWRSFELLVEEFDCVIVKEESKIWKEIVDYLKVMLWVQ